MDVQHPLDERALQLGRRAGQDVEAGACDPRATLKVDDAERGAKVPVRLRLEIVLANLAPLARDDVVLLGRAAGHGGVGQVWQVAEALGDLLIKVCRAFGGLINLFRESTQGGLERVNQLIDTAARAPVKQFRDTGRGQDVIGGEVAATCAAAQHSEGLGLGVELRAQVIGAGLRRAPLAIETTSSSRASDSASPRRASAARVSSCASLIRRLSRMIEQPPIDRVGDYL